jgi:AcrR family transcriptional regulator
MSKRETHPRTQDERSAAMRERLINATLETILECGYSGATLVGIAKKAGVTRGALNHHFDSKDDLIVEAMSDMLKKGSAEIRGYAESVQNGTLSPSEFLDRVWEIFSGPFFMVTLEQITASRHNDVLKNRLVVVTRDFHKALDEIWSSFFTTNELQQPQLETILNATLCLFRGMGAQTVLREDPAYYQRLLSFWKDILFSTTGITFKSK